MIDSRLRTRLAAMNSALVRAKRALDELTLEIEEARSEEESERARMRTHLSIDEAASALGVSRSTINRRLEDGTIASIKIGGRRLIQLEQLEACGSRQDPR
jgi:excisionase family DNA binding protein